MEIHTPQWFSWTREIFTICKAGLAYSKNEYDLERYKRLLEINAEIIESQSTLEKESVLESFSMQAGYATPKVDVRGAVIRDGKILLVQEKADGNWAMPGGWADLGDTPAETVAREVWEETGFTVKVDKLIGIYDGNRLQPFEFHHAYKLIFLCSVTGGGLTANIETLAVDFFNPNALPTLSESRTNKRMLAEVFAHAADPLRLTYFE
jgi:ADP-ribose pyrophosphatase YjhB (NUDIX family)